MNRYQTFLTDTVFAGKNKEYGAYQLRMEYENNMTKGFFFSIGFVAFCFLSGLFYIGAKESDLVTVITLPNIIEEEPNREVAKIKILQPIEKPQPVASAPIKQEQVKFNENISIVNDNIKTDANVPTQKILENAVISNVDVKGTSEGSGNALGTEGPKETKGNTTVVSTPPTPPTKPYDLVQKMPAFPNGEKALFEYFSKMLKYPSIARETGIQGTVVLQFVVNTSGKIEEIKLMRGIGGGCDEEAIRVVKAMPLWSPGVHNGREVPVRMTLPIKFALKD